MCQLVKGSATLESRREVSDADYQLATRVALDCIPALRRSVLDAIVRGESLKGVVPASTLSYIKQDLEALGLIEGSNLSELSVQRLGMAEVLGPVH